MANERELVLAKAAEFAAHCEARHAAYLEEHGLHCEANEADFYVDKGARKYARIVRADRHGSSRSVHCFVRLSDGAILKAAGWKAPAKHARGNIFDSFTAGMSEHGAAYL